jgi:hypothetical protein
MNEVVVSAKTTSDASSIPASSFPPDPNSSQSTINTVAREITEAGGSSLALPVDVRNVENVKDLVDETVKYNVSLSATPPILMIQTSWLPRCPSL